MVKALEALFGNQTDVNKGDDSAYYAENYDGEDVVLDIVDFNGCHTGNDHQVKGEAGNAVHLIVIDIAAVHQVVSAQTLYHKLDEHGCKGGPQEIEAPGDAVGEIGENAQKIHKAEGDGIGQSHKAHLKGEFIHRFVIGNFAAAGIGLVDKFTGRSFAANTKVTALFVNVDIQHTEDGCHHETNGSERKAETAVASKLSGGSIGEVDVPTQCIAGALTEGQRQDQTTDVGSDLFAVAGQKEHNEGDAKAGKCLQHIGAALQCAEFKDLCAVGLVGALFCFQTHGGKADGKAVVGDDLHQAVIYQHETQLLGNDIHHQQHSAAQKSRRNQTFSEKRNGAAENIANHQKHQQKAKLHQKCPNGTIVGHGENI